MHTAGAISSNVKFVDAVKKRLKTREGEKESDTQASSNSVTNWLSIMQLLLLIDRAK